MTLSPPPTAAALLDLPTVVESLREGIQVVDWQWRYRYLNLAAATHARRPREELVGRTMMECYSGIARSHRRLLLEDVLETWSPRS